MTKTNIKSLVAEGYKGQYESIVGELKIEGSFSTDGEKKLNNVSGMVMKDTERQAGFNAYRQGEDFRYNFSEIKDLDDMAAISEAVKEAVADISARLARTEEE